MLDRIQQIHHLRHQIHAIHTHVEKLSKPLLTDQTLIPRLYEWFCEILNERNLPPLMESVTQRKKFLFITLYLYSPSTLVGEKMVKGLREKLAEVLEIKAHSTISDNCADVAFLYQNYKDYRQEVEAIYTEILRRLRKTKEDG